MVKVLGLYGKERRSYEIAGARHSDASFATLTFRRKYFPRRAYGSIRHPNRVASLEYSASHRHADTRGHRQMPLLVSAQDNEDGPSS